MKVKLSKKGIQTFPYMKDAEGEIIGLSREEHCLRIQWNTKKTPETIAKVYLRKKDSSHDK